VTSIRNTNIIAEVLALLHWDGDFLAAFQKAHASYIRAGSPGVPITSENYQHEFRLRKRRDRYAAQKARA
jgi:hypothetical protein